MNSMITDSTLSQTKLGNNIKLVKKLEEKWRQPISAVYMRKSF